MSILNERLRAAFDRATDFVFPPHCALCDRLLAAARTEAGFCDECERALSWIAPPLCLRCGIPFNTFDARTDARVPVPRGHLCGACIQDPPPFESARSAVRYEGAVRGALLSLKYGRRFDLTRALVTLSQRAFDENYSAAERPETLCSVPLHPARLREREFDQARLLAKRLARAVGLPYETALLARVRRTPPQTRLSPAERERNVRGAFSLSRPERARGRYFLLVDDVLTTGATVSECARVLLKAGARRVDVLTPARAVPE